ncbi:MAG TPA: hypothetical protein VL001_02870 [Candidimonas sp.]|nr:hypothetical protein [Candidimonas sp.]
MTAVGSSCRAAARQQGQALVLGMLLMGTAILVFIRYFDTGQVVAAKARQLHALDAAAYSGALVQARALNMLAYINRAHVGHQVAMAHLVTLGSWASLGGAEARQLMVGDPPAYVVAMMFGPAHGAAYAAARRATGFERQSDSGGTLARAYSDHDAVVRNVLATVQSDIAQGLAQVRMAAMQAVLSANYPEARAQDGHDLRIEADTLPGFLTRYSAEQRLRPFIQGVSSLYGFLGPRNDTVSNPWTVDPRCPSWRHQLRRRGSTELDASGVWKSIDTQSYHAVRSNQWIGCYYREYAMGWGWIPSAATQTMSEPHSDHPPDNFGDQDFWRWVRESTEWDIATGDANPLANSRAAVSRQQWQGGGLPTYFDTSPQSGGKPLYFGVSLHHEGANGLTMHTRSAAETFFMRPQTRMDGQVEAPNIFHPYWQARLAPKAGSVVVGRGAP